MKIGIVYTSPNGTTKKVAETLGGYLKGQDREVHFFDIGELLRDRTGFKIPASIKEMDILGFGSPIYHMRLIKPMNFFLSELSSRSTKATKAFYFGTYGGITSGKVLTETGKKLKDMGMDTCGAGKFYAPHFWHTDGYPNEEIREQIKQFASKMIEKNFRPIPLNELRRKVGPMKFAASLLYPIIPKISKKRVLPIDIEPELCVSCGKCVRQCPIGAVSIKNGTALIDQGKCMHCYHCTIICPKDAIKCETEKLQNFIKMNKRIIGVETPPTCFWVAE